MYQMSFLSDENRYKIFKLLEENPGLNQRQLAKALNISLGKANYCLNALIEKGSIKARRFHKSSNKRAYIYLLTPKGIEEKARVTIRFLKHKQAEYELLMQDLQELREEVARLGLKGNIKK